MKILIDILIIIICVFLIVLPVLIGVAFLTLIERKVIASIQRRIGPNVVGPFGLLQPLADALKLIAKEIVIPNQTNKYIFILAPILTFIFSMVPWSVIPLETLKSYANISLGLLFLMAIGSLGTYGIIMAGWSSNSKYAFLGALRSAAQLLSYEIGLGLIFVNIIIFTGSMNFQDISDNQDSLWYVVPMDFLFISCYICCLAETNRTPFDLPEAEAELVAGYNVEYSGISFAFFYLGEYSHMLVWSTVLSLNFLGGWSPPAYIIPFIYIPGSIWIAMKSVLLVVGFVKVRALVPRYRYDQLMRIGWKILIPITFGWVIFYSGGFITFSEYASIA